MAQQGDMDNFEAGWHDGEEAAKPAEASAAEAPAADAGAKGDSYEAAWAEDAPKAGIDPRVAAGTAAHEPAKFSEAFAAARKEGKSAFNWNGKAYTTKLASDKPKAKPAAPKAEAKPATAPTQAAGSDEAERLARRAPASNDKPAKARNWNDLPALASEAKDAVKSVPQKVAGADAAMKNGVRSGSGWNDVPGKVGTAVKDALDPSKPGRNWNDVMSDALNLPRSSSHVAKN